jgi:hypothetical protein
MAGARDIRNLVIGVILGAVVLGCSPAASVSPSAAAAPSTAVAPSELSSTAPSAASSGGTIVLTRTGPIGCDTIGVDYTSATIRIDAAADPDVWAETDAGKKLAVRWTDGFTATDTSPPVIKGPKSEDVARDGTKIDVPAAAYPRLVGYFVCLGPDALSVLETDPQ